MQNLVFSAEFCSPVYFDIKIRDPPVPLVPPAAGCAEAAVPELVGCVARQECTAHADNPREPADSPSLVSATAHSLPESADPLSV